MDKEQTIQYWLISARDDWRVANQLFEKEEYPYALFFGHLTIEKILKAIYTDKHNEVAPFTHRLVYLAEKIPLSLTDNQLELLEIFTDFNLEARYPDEKFSFKKRCTKKFAEEYSKKMEEMKKWLLNQIQK